MSYELLVIENFSYVLDTSGSTWGGAGCTSNATFSGDGYVEFEAKTQTANVMMGLSFTSPNHHYNTIDYALYYITGDRLVVYESGSLKMTTTVSEGDLCRVMRVGNKIRYYRNSELLREVEETNPANMMADFTFYQSGARIYNPKIVDVAYQHRAQYIADVKSYSDYYAGGMLMPNRHGGENYRYNFQGQETDDEIKGKGNSVNYKYRMADVRLNRFFAVDPLASKYPHYTPYSFSGNKVIAHIELEGLEGIYFDKSFKDNNGEAAFKLYSSTDIGKEAIAKFESTIATEKDVGNNGYDIVYIATDLPKGKNGYIKDVFKNTLQNVHTGEEISAAKAIEMGIMGDEEQEAWNKVLLGPDPEIYENAKVSLIKGRGVIVIAVNLDLLKSSESNDEHAVQAARTVGHELDFHVINHSRDKNVSVFTEHGQNTGNYGKNTPAIPIKGTKDYKMTEQIREAQKKQNSNEKK